MGVCPNYLTGIVKNFLRTSASTLAVLTTWMGLSGIRETDPANNQDTMERTGVRGIGTAGIRTLRTNRDLR